MGVDFVTRGEMEQAIEEGCVKRKRSDDVQFADLVDKVDNIGRQQDVQGAQVGKLQRSVDKVTRKQHAFQLAMAEGFEHLADALRKAAESD